LWIQQKNAKDAPISAMNDRENAFEAKCAHDAKMQFKAEARGNKLLRRTGADAQAYAVEVVKSDFEEAAMRTCFAKSPVVWMAARTRQRSMCKCPH
jgi:hypothetical protein